jgi:hypothetical protein
MNEGTQLFKLEDASDCLNGWRIKQKKPDNFTSSGFLYVFIPLSGWVLIDFSYRHKCLRNQHFLLNAFSFTFFSVFLKFTFTNITTITSSNVFTKLLSFHEKLLYTNCRLNRNIKLLSRNQFLNFSHFFTYRIGVISMHQDDKASTIVAFNKIYFH